MNFLDPGEVAEAISAVRELEVDPRLIVFDTWARCLTGGDENSAKDVGEAIAELDELRFELECAVVVVHHTGKTGKEDRGSGALTGAVDTKLRLEPANGSNINISLTVEKQKNFERGEALNLTLQRVADSLVPVEAPAGGPRPAGALATQPEGTEAGPESKLAEDLTAALRQLDSENKLPVTQTTLTKVVSGNKAMKDRVLKALADDENSDVIMEQKGNSNMYSLFIDSDSVIHPL